MPSERLVAPQVLLLLLLLSVIPSVAPFAIPASSRPTIPTQAPLTSTNMVPLENSCSNASSGNTASKPSKQGTSQGASRDNAPRRATKMHLILDFDGTCTMKDTVSVLPQLASIHANDDVSVREQRMSNFLLHQQEYFDLYGQLKDTILTRSQSDLNAEPHPADNSASFTTLDAALDALDDVSTHVTKRVSQSGCLAGLPQEKLEMRQLIDTSDVQFRDALQLRDNCARVVAGAHHSGWNLGVLSINWCRSLIDAVLIHPIEIMIQDQAVSAGAPHFDVWCNGLDADGKITLDVPGAISKRECIAKVRRDEGFVVYIGDSSTDLLALLEADIGILIGGSQSASGMAELWDIQLLPLSQRPQSCEQRCNTVWTTEDWNEIEDMLQHACPPSHVAAPDASCKESSLRRPGIEV